MSGNEEAWRLIRLASGQWRCDWSGPIGLDYGAIIRMAEALGIRVDETLLEKIHAYEREILRISRERTEGKRAGGSPTCDEEKVLDCRARYGDEFDAVCGLCPEQPVKSKR